MRPRPTMALWVVAVLLAFIAGMLWRSADGGGLVSTATAQTSPLAGARGVFAFTGPLDQGKYGVFMLDVDQGTLWCYEIETVEGVRKLRLIAGRSWIYDRYLKNFNVVPPDYLEIQGIVARERTSEPAAPNREIEAPAGAGASRAP